MKQAEPFATGSIFIGLADGPATAQTRRWLEDVPTPLHFFPSLAALCERAQTGIQIATLILDCRLLPSHADGLADCVDGQPSWQDIPILVLPDCAAPSTALAAFNHVTRLASPLSPERLVTAVRAALHLRGGQMNKRHEVESLQQQVTALQQQLDALTRRHGAAEGRARAFFQTAWEAQCILTTDGKLLDANARALRAIEGVADGVIGRDFWDTPWFAHSPAAADTIRAMIATTSGGHVVRQDITLNLAGDRRSFELCMRPVTDLQGAILELVCEGVETTQSRLAADALRQAQKMEAIGQLTGGVAHDFNNLLTVVSGNLALLQRRLAHEPVLLRLVNSAAAAADRGAKLTHQLLAFARRQSLQAVDVDLNEVVYGIAELLQRTVGGAAPLRIACCDRMLPVRVDRNQLEMAVLNLVVNARDASGQGDEIVVQTAWLDDAAPSATAFQVALSVRDSGEGMAPDVLERACEPFFTTKSAGAGTGLGLSMVYGFVRQSGGDVQIESTQGKGTTVHLLFPDSEPPTPVEQHTDDIRPSQGERILVVEDDPGVQAVAVAVLEQLGYPVCVASNGDAGLRMLKEDAGIDLLFTDVIMPGSIDGLTLTRLAREVRPELRIIITSGRLPEDADLQAVLGARGTFLAKPYEPVQLALAVQTALDAGD